MEAGLEPQDAQHLHASCLSSSQHVAHTTQTVHESSVGCIQSRQEANTPIPTRSNVCYSKVKDIIQLGHISGLLGTPQYCSVSMSPQNFHSGTENLSTISDLTSHKLCHT